MFIYKKVLFSNKKQFSYKYSRLTLKLYSFMSKSIFYKIDKIKIYFKFYFLFLFNILKNKINDGNKDYIYNNKYYYLTLFIQYFNIIKF